MYEIFIFQDVIQKQKTACEMTVVLLHAISSMLQQAAALQKQGGSRKTANYSAEEGKTSGAGIWVWSHSAICVMRI